MITYLFLESTKRCFIVRFRRWFNVDNLTLFRRWLSFQRWYKDFIYLNIMTWEQICFQSQPKINVVSTINFIDESTFTNRPWLNVDVTLTDVATLFQYTSTLNQRCVFGGLSYLYPSVFPFFGLTYILLKTSIIGFSWFCCICVYIFVNISYLVVSI